MNKAKDRISELRDSFREIIQTEAQRGKKKEKGTRKRTNGKHVGHCQMV